MQNKNDQEQKPRKISIPASNTGALQKNIEDAIGKKYLKPWKEQSLVDEAAIVNDYDESKASEPSQQLIDEA